MYEQAHSTEEIQAFLQQQPKHHYEKRQLTSAPGIELLRWLPVAPVSVGLYYVEPDWIIVRGFEEGMYLKGVINQGNPKIHTARAEVPGINNFHIISNPYQPPFIPGHRYVETPQDQSKHLITSPVGITHYWPVTNFEHRRRIDAEAHREWGVPIDDPRRRAEYLDFLQQNGARFEIHGWESLNEEKLTALLQPSYG